MQVVDVAHSDEAAVLSGQCRVQLPDGRRRGNKLGNQGLGPCAGGGEESYLGGPGSVVGLLLLRLYSEGYVG